jgi:ribosomal protein uL22
MANFGYSYKGTGAKFAKSQVNDVDASFKDLGAVCDAIRYKKADAAVELLEKVSEGDTPVLYRTHNKHLGHRHELGGKKGRYPKKSAKLVLVVLKNAIANASFKGLDEELVVKHACANKQRIMPRMAPRGTSRRSNYETARIEIVLEEWPEAAKAFEGKKGKAAKELKTAAQREKFVSGESKKVQAEVKRLLEKRKKEKEEKNEKHEHAHEGHKHEHGQEHSHDAHKHDHGHSHGGHAHPQGEHAHDKK